MDKRLLTFMMLALAVMSLNGLVIGWLFPPKPKAPAAQAAKGAKDPAAAKDAGKDGDKPADAKPEPEKADGEAPAVAAEKKPEKKPADAAAPSGEQPEGAKVADAKPEAKPDPDAAKQGNEKGDEKAAAAAEPDTTPEEWHTLGSFDPAAPYRMLVTIANRGAAVERIELNNPRYLDLDVASGYLGHLEPADAPDRAGALVRLVGSATPAEQAGLKVGDVIQAIGDKPVHGVSGLLAALAETKPAQEIEVAIMRDGQQQKLKVKLVRKPLDVVRPEYEQKDVEMLDDKHDPLSALFTLDQVGAATVPAGREELPDVNLRNGLWEFVSKNAHEAVLQRRLPKLGLRVVKKFTLAEVKESKDPLDPAYHLIVTVEIHNEGAEKTNVAYRLLGATGLPIEGAWYANKVNQSAGSDLRTIVARVAGKDWKETGCTNIANEKDVEIWVDPQLEYGACGSQYFSAAMIPETGKPTPPTFREFKPVRVGNILPDANLKRMTNISFLLTSQLETLEKGYSMSHSYRLFAGPNKPDLLAEYVAPKFGADLPVTLRDLIYYGWPIFGYVAAPMQRLMHFFYDIVGNYGLSILMLTAVIRGAMFPLSRKQALSTAKMQEIQPEIKKINEKYKKNPQEKNKAMQELFRKNNCNPLGGCLPAVIQLPIFMGLYRSLAVDVELRQAPLISSAIHWCSNLAAPDMLWNWSAYMPASVNQGAGILGLGPYLNVLPLVTVGLFILQQRMFMPPPVDEQAAMQQKMMQFMMIFMGLMFYKVASGLCIYFIASSVWSICERKLIPKTLPASGQK